MKYRKRRYTKPGEKFTDVESYFLNGPVKSMMEAQYHASMQNSEVVQGKLEVDSAGSETNVIFHFNKNGTRILEQKYGAGSYYSETRYTDTGLMLEIITVYKSGTHQKTTFSYDAQNRNTGSIATDQAGITKYRTESVYFEDTHQQLEHLTFHGHGENEKLFRKEITTYGNFLTEVNGLKYYNVLSRIEYNGEGKIECTHTYAYDENGKQIENKTQHTDEKKAKYDRHFISKFNSHGDCIQQIISTGGQEPVVHNYTHEYDSEGKRIVPPRPANYDPYALEPGESEEITETDHHNNWLKKITFFEKRPVNMIVRQFKYYGDPSENEPDFIHPATTEKKEDVKIVAEDVEPWSNADAKWLAERTGNPEIFPVAAYFAFKWGELPSVVHYQSSYIEAFAVLQILKEKLTGRIIHSTGIVHGGWAERMNRYTLSFAHYPGYLLYAPNIHSQGDEEYIIPSYVKKNNRWGEQVHFSTLQLFRPSDASGKRNEWFEDMLGEHISDCTLRRKPEKPFIHIVEMVGGNFVMKEHPVDDNFEIRDLNINYGYGFQQFHDDLMQRFNKSTKGLVLFHGQPGTGKTYYIRHLLRTMVTNRKVVIYMPPNMVDHLTDPAFMTFLTHEVRDFSAEGNFCVLLIEDAEPLLAKRQEGVRIQGVTNLLNLSDGLLNDMLNLQIICTFNVDLKKLDSALLRPGRLLARKEFKALGELDANLLAQRLGIKHHFKKPATLSQIYSMIKNQHTLIHDVDPDKDASTILDDL